MISTNNIKASPISIGGEMTTKDWKGVFFVQQDQQHISPRNGGENVTVEADVSDGLPGLILVGYLASEVREGGDRVRTAIKNLGLSCRQRRSRSICLRQILERKEPALIWRSPRRSCHHTEDSRQRTWRMRYSSGNWGWTGLCGDPGRYGAHGTGTGEWIPTGISSG